MTCFVKTKQKTRVNPPQRHFMCIYSDAYSQHKASLVSNEYHYFKFDGVYVVKKIHTLVIIF